MGQLIRVNLLLTYPYAPIDVDKVWLLRLSNFTTCAQSDTVTRNCALRQNSRSITVKEFKENDLIT